MMAAGVRYAAAIPDVHKLAPVGLPPSARDDLSAAYEGRSTAVKALLATMAASLPRDHEDLCPFCSLDTGAELDHYLPKAKFPELSHEPRNLVPICGICNKSKGDSVANAEGNRQFLYPLHDQAGGSHILRASLSFAEAAHARYFLDAPATLPAVQFQLADRHFRKLGLAARYSRRANGVLAPLKRSLRLYNPGVIRRTLAGGLRDARNTEPANGWRRALHEALAADVPATIAWISG